MKNCKIGYQGMEGSWSEQASLEFIEKMNFKKVELIPLITSKKVVEYLEDGKIDYGVMATKNSIGGPVEETKKALIGKEFNELETLDLSIHHRLFKKHGVPIKDINRVVSHEQAIKQTRNNIKKVFGDIRIDYSEDTAISARLLAEGKLSDTTSVICSKKAGEKYKLDCVCENMEDYESITTFVLFEKILETSNK